MIACGEQYAMDKKKIFLSYCSADFMFAEMLSIKLAAKGHELWRDADQIRAGDDWRDSIEEGIEASDGVVVALSSKAASSAYVTFEWAYAIGMKKPLIPIILEACDLHPKLEPTQYLDFSYPRALPWDDLMERIEAIESPEEISIAETRAPTTSDLGKNQEEKYVRDILSYLGRNGFRMASFERLRKRIDPKLSDGWFEEIIRNNPKTFRKATLKGKRSGLAKRVP